LQSSAREVINWELVIDNAINARFANATTASQIFAQDRTITLNATVPYNSSNSALYAQAVAGAAGTLVITNGGYSTTFTFGRLQVPEDSPVAPGRGSEVVLNLPMTARAVSTTKELVVTHDSAA